MSAKRPETRVTLTTMEPGTAIASALSYAIDGREQVFTRTPGGLGTDVIEPLRVEQSTLGPAEGGLSQAANVLEVLVYDRPLTPEERVTAEDALRDRQGL